MIELIQVRDCDGKCCEESPRWPNADHSDCKFHDTSAGKENGGCMLMRGEADIPAICEVMEGMNGAEAFKETCTDFPQNTIPHVLKTGGCCWQWVENGES